MAGGELRPQIPLNLKESLETNQTLSLKDAHVVLKLTECTSPSYDLTKYPILVYCKEMPNKNLYLHTVDIPPTGAVLFDTWEKII